MGKFYLGDSLELIPKHIEDRSVDLIFADLPYETTKCSWDKMIPLNNYVLVDDKVLYEDEYILHRAFSSYDSVHYIKDEFDEIKNLGLWSHYDRVIKDDGAILLYAQTPFDKFLGESVKKSGTEIKLRYEWVWEKTQATGHLNAKKMPMKAHENILVFYKKLPTYNPQKTTGHERKVSKAYQRDICIKRRKEKWGDNYLYGEETTAPDYDSTERYPRSVLKFASDKQKSCIHRTQKPLALTEYMIKTYSNEGDLVLDNCAGSGTVGVACDELNRNWIMMEKGEKEYNDAKNRLSQRGI